MATFSVMKSFWGVGPHSPTLWPREVFGRKRHCDVLVYKIRIDTGHLQVYLFVGAPRNKMNTYVPQFTLNVLHCIDFTCPALLFSSTPMRCFRAWVRAAPDSGRVRTRAFLTSRDAQTKSCQNGVIRERRRLCERHRRPGGPSCYPANTAINRATEVPPSITPLFISSRAEAGKTSPGIESRRLVVPAVFQLDLMKA